MTKANVRTGTGPGKFRTFEVPAVARATGDGMMPSDDLPLMQREGERSLRRPRQGEAPPECLGQPRAMLLICKPYNEQREACQAARSGGGAKELLAGALYRITGP